MIFYLHKLLPLIASPMGLVIFLMLLGILFRRWLMILFSCFVLIASAFPVTGYFIWQDLESAYPPKAINKLGSYDAVVVLSGMLSVANYNNTSRVEWNDPDRFFAGVDVIKSGKAPVLIFTRGKVPWNDVPAEGDLLKIKAIELGISHTDVLLSDIASNTEEEARAVKKLMKESDIKTILLVTSSFHMPRAKLLFDRQEINSDTFPVDFRATGRELNWLSFLPSASGFRSTSDGIREYIGRLYYRLKFA